MAYATAKNIDINSIPVIDVAPLFEGPEGERRIGRQLLKAMDQIGFFYIENHGISKAFIDDVFSVAQRFFSASREDKHSVRVRDCHRDFLPIGEATMSGNVNKDLKESFVWGWDVAAEDPDIKRSGGMLAANRWPGFVPEMSGVLTT